MAPRVMFVGLDAMDAGIATRLAADGRMPTLRRLLADSLRATTVNPEGLVVGACWPSTWSGTPPGRHGFYCFRQLVPGRYEIRRHTPLDIPVTPFWMPLAAAGQAVAVFDMPLVAPTEPSDGIHVVDLGTHDRMLAPSAFPAGLAAELVARHGDHPVIGRCDHYAAEGRWAELAETLERAATWRASVSTDLLARRQWDVFATVFSEGHCAGHQFWWLHDQTWPTHDPGLAAALDDPLVRVYEAVDRSLGRILSHADPATRVAVVLSHGIGPHHDGDHLFGEIVRRLENARGRRGVVRRGRELALRRGRRAVRGLQARLRPDDPRSRPATAVDGSRRFFPIPNNDLYGAVRLNLAGREPRGLVQPGAEADALLDWLVDEFGRLVDADTGQPIVRRTLRVDTLHDGPRRDHLPDLLVDWHRAAPITSASSPTIGTVRGRADNSRTGDHRPAGLVLLRGPGIVPGALGRPVASTDIAPTLCAWAGIELATADGRPIPEAVSPPADRPYR